MGRGLGLGRPKGGEQYRPKLQSMCFAILLPRLEGAQLTPLHSSLLWGWEHRARLDIPPGGSENTRLPFVLFCVY